MIESRNARRPSPVRRILWLAFLALSLVVLLTANALVSRETGWRNSVAEAAPALQSTVPPFGLFLNEVMAQPASGEEYIELYSTFNFDLPLGGWILDDVVDAVQGQSPAGSPAYTIPAGTIISAGGFLAFYRSQTGIVLDDAGDEVWLFYPVPNNDVAQDSFSYSSSVSGKPWSRVVDGFGGWAPTCASSPGLSNESFTPCCPDFSGNNIVDVNDMIAVAEAWNQAPPGNPAFDRDGDGTVTVVDILQIVYRFGDSCTP